MKITTYRRHAGLISLSLVTVFATGPAFAASNWPSAGADLNNSRYQAGASDLSSKTVGTLRKKWEFKTVGDVTATPTIDESYLYFPDSAGYLYKVNRFTGALVWQRKISDYTGIAGDFARASPAIAGSALIIGNQSGKLQNPLQPQPAQVFAVDKVSGNLLWHTQLDQTQYSFVTHSAIVDRGIAYFGLASNEELVAGFVPKASWQFKFRGNVVAIDAVTGVIKWKTFMVPDGYAGGAIWGSTGAIDRVRNQLYMSTGNNYAVPQGVSDCLNAGGTPSSCMSPENHFDSIVAMDLTTGAIKWTGRGLPYDAWNVGCGLNIPGVFTVQPNDNCPAPKGPDWDFAQGPMLLPGNGDSGSVLVGAGQKSGKFWAFNAVTGALAWVTQVAPGGLTGGLQWGSATDGSRIFVAVANSGLTGAGTTPETWTLANGSTTTAGGWASLSAKSGAVLWTTKDPAGSRAEGAVSATSDIVFGCNLSTLGTMYAIEAKTGAVLWSYDSGGACSAGPSISDGMVYWGSGTFSGYGPHKVFGFGL